MKVMKKYLQRLVVWNEYTLRDIMECFVSAIENASPNMGPKPPLLDYSDNMLFINNRIWMI